MSLVGPRPEALWLVERYSETERFRLEMRPGITGPMQVHGRGELTFQERLAVEREYVENYSLRKDVKILMRTVSAVVRARGAFYEALASALGGRAHGQEEERGRYPAEHDGRGKEHRSGWADSCSRRSRMVPLLVLRTTALFRLPPLTERATMGERSQPSRRVGRLRVDRHKRPAVCEFRPVEAPHGASEVRLARWRSNLRRTAGQGPGARCSWRGRTSRCSGRSPSPQPLLDLLGDSPEFFVARGNTRGDILLLAFTLVLVPPTVLALVEAAFMRVPRVREALHLAFVAVLVAALALQVVTDVLDGLPAYAAIALAAALGAGAAALYARREGLRTFLTVLSPAPAVFLALFLLVSPVSDLVLPQDDVRAAGVGGGTDAPVVMVVFDEFSGGSLLDRRLRIDASRYPNFAELARRSTWYRNATTVDYQTSGPCRRS